VPIAGGALTVARAITGAVTRGAADGSRVAWPVAGAVTVPAEAAYGLTAAGWPPVAPAWPVPGTAAPGTDGEAPEGVRSVGSSACAS
jgi:hypothetical protein